MKLSHRQDIQPIKPISKIEFSITHNSIENYYTIVVIQKIYEEWLDHTWKL